jgi:hypothetical protein
MGARSTRKTRAPKKSGQGLPIEADERHQDEVDDFITRNRDALNESIRRSRRELDKGIRSKRTIDELIADARGRNKSRT